MSSFELSDSETKPLLSDAWYEVFKKTITLFLPGLGTLYFAIAQIWGLPAAEEIVGTIVAVCTFLGLFLRQAEKSYDKSDTQFDGNMVISEADHPEYADKKKVKLRVVKAPVVDVVDEDDF